MVSGVSSRPPWSTSGPRPTIASVTSVDNSARSPSPASLEQMHECPDRARVPFSPDAAHACAPPQPDWVREIVG